MCVVVVKYVNGYGWVGAKNRDRNYKTDVAITQSNRHGVQRLFIDDKLSRWSEGVNEHGLAIISSSFSVKSDEKEGDKIISKKKKRDQIGYYSPDGRVIRKGLLEKTPKAALKLLVDLELAGATYVFNESECYILEGGYTVRKADASSENPREYKHVINKISRNEPCSCRTNHGIIMKELGYHKNPTDDRIIRARKSSEKRLDFTRQFASPDISNPGDLIDMIAKCPDDDVFMNPMRTGNIKKGEMVTTGQLLIVPKQRTLHYRPIYSSVEFDYNRLSGPESKTFFEIISSRKLLSFKEFTDK